MTKRKKEQLERMLTSVMIDSVQLKRTKDEFIKTVERKLKCSVSCDNGQFICSFPNEKCIIKVGWEPVKQ